ncbi:hypothetical protein BUALT_Bualt11G0037100 [Buddleja alternifolia]|uniref:Reverse transcriptase/retrotransposon-derived protein RNase H-like domain-containing protein n=1 Tax=Buddleja alternifolia TaxID=168488 RepID=A0AAV6WSC1_9LAMI|nr:hypothetical protein BUALT_Bualt11G0037100 [Buddleja alternifolia]
MFTAKLSKCVFAVSRIHYLGHVISGSVVSVDMAKIQSILDWHVPTTVSALRGFLSLTGYYRIFVHHYAQIASPLTDLLHASKFEWDTKSQQSFDTLKTKMTTVPVLALPDFSASFDITTAVGAVLF